MKYTKFVTSMLAIAATSFVLADEAAQAELEKAPETSAFAAVDFVNSYIPDSGYVADNDFVIQPYFEFSFKAFDVLPLTISTWANYSTQNNGGMGDDQGFTEIDYAVSTSYATDFGMSFTPTLVVWTYPGAAEFVDEDLVAKLVISQSITDFLSAGVQLEYMIDGGSKKDYQILPFVEASANVTDDVSVSAKANFYYKNDNDGENGWANFSIKGAVSYRNFSVYARHWIQMDDDVYTDEQNDKQDFQYGLSYGVAF